MTCKLCKSYAFHTTSCNEKWISRPCFVHRKDVIVEHSRSLRHQNSESRAKEKKIGEAVGDITDAIQGGVVISKKEAVINAFECVYWLAQEELPVFTKFKPLLKLATILGVPIENELNISSGVNYTSNRFIHEILTEIYETQFKLFLITIKASPCYALLIDEMTDVSVRCQLMVYIKYISINNQTVETSFFQLKKLTDGKAATITKALKDMISEYGLDDTKLAALGSDGASVMVGRKNGVAAKLKENYPSLVGHHCIAHRLALASVQGMESIPYLKKFSDLLLQLFSYYSNSPLRSEKLRSFQMLLNEPTLKIVRAVPTRWLSHEKAVKTLHSCFSSVLSSLSANAQELNDATAFGLHKQLTSYDFIATLLMMCDILAPLSWLSKAFQKANIDFLTVSSLLDGTSHKLKQLLDKEGDYFSSLPKVIEEISSTERISSSKYADFKNQIYCKYINNVLRNLEQRFPNTEILEAFCLFDLSVWPHCSSDINKYLLILSSWYQQQFKILNYKSLLNDWEYFEGVATAQQFNKKPAHEVMLELQRPTWKESLPHLSLLAALGLIIPQSTADCERGGSSLNRIKNDFRNRLSNEGQYGCLNPLMFLSIEGPEFGSDSAVTLIANAVDSWARKKNRRIKLT